MFEPLTRMLGGLAVGVVFGFLLQKGQVAKYRVIMQQLTLERWTVAKIMATAIVVGGLGIYAMAPSGAVALHLKPLLVGGVVLGGVSFGLGLALLGYCPGTSIAACAEGRRDAMVGVLGGLVGSGVFVALHDSWSAIQAWGGDHGKLTLPEVTGVPAWLWLGALGLVIAAVILRRRVRGPRSPERRSSGGWRSPTASHP